MTSAYAIILIPIRGGWAVSLTNGRQLRSFHGPLARSRALRYLTQITGAASRLRGLHWL
jgi:hypothetical protein